MGAKESMACALKKHDVRAEEVGRRRMRGSSEYLFRMPVLKLGFSVFGQIAARLLLFFKRKRKRAMLLVNLDVASFESVVAEARFCVSNSKAGAVKRIHVRRVCTR